MSASPSARSVPAGSAPKPAGTGWRGDHLDDLESPASDGDQVEPAVGVFGDLADLGGAADVVDADGLRGRVDFPAAADGYDPEDAWGSVR